MTLERALPIQILEQFRAEVIFAIICYLNAARIFLGVIKGIEAQAKALLLL